MRDLIFTSSATRTLQKLRPGFWKRLLRAYRFKKYSHQNFFATIVALQVSSMVFFVLLVLFFMVRGSAFDYSFLPAGLS